MRWDIIIYAVFVLFMWFMFRGMIKEGKAQTTYPMNYLFLLGKEYGGK